MSARLRIISLVAALVAALAFLALHGWKKDDSDGMTATPCAENGRPITGDPADDWAQLCAYRRANERLLERGEHPKIVMIGDSITAQWPMPGREFLNRGIGGQTSSQMLLRFQQDVIALRPRVIHILAGINDVSGNTGPVSPDMFQNNIRAMVEMAQAHDIDVILGTIGPARDYDWRPRVRRAHWVLILNDWLLNYAREQDLVVADYHAVLSHGDGSLRDDLLPDGLHPNDKGYAAMNKVLLDAVARSGGRDAISDRHEARSGL